MMHPGASQQDNSPVINLMIDVDTPPSPSDEEIRITEVNLHKMYEKLRDSNGTATLFLTQDVTLSRIRLLLAQYTVLSDLEFAVSGNHSDDNFSTMSRSEQEAILQKSVKIAKASKVCGQSEVNIYGFMPYSFNQNEDTYKAIDALGLEYDAGFQEGIIYTPDHGEDFLPYKVDGHNFYAVPISTYDVSGKKMPLYDRQFNEKAMTASEWYDILVSKLDESSSRGEPMVVLFSTSISGTEEYFKAFKNFIDYAKSKDATFIKTIDLVFKSKTGAFQASEKKSVCITCGQDEGFKASISVKEMNDTYTNISSPL